MKCPEAHCNGESEISRPSPSGADIHLCGECGGEWSETAIDHQKREGGSFGGVTFEEFAGDFPQRLAKALGPLAAGESEKVGVSELQSKITWLKPSGPTLDHHFTATDIAEMREHADKMAELRDMIDEHVYRQW